eukprot:42293-Pleurochrysis_carterae.AAC.1
MVHAARGVVSRHDVYVRGGAPRVHSQSTGDWRRCSRSSDVPFVKPAAADEGEPTACAVCSWGEFHCAGAGKAAVDSGGSP